MRRSDPLSAAFTALSRTGAVEPGREGGRVGTMTTAPGTRNPGAVSRLLRVHLGTRRRQLRTRPVGRAPRPLRSTNQRADLAASARLLLSVGRTVADLAVTSGRRDLRVAHVGSLTRRTRALSTN